MEAAPLGPVQALSPGVANRVERVPGPQYQVEPRAKKSVDRASLQSPQATRDFLRHPSPTSTRLAFLLVVIGYGTRAGFHGLGRFWAPRQLLNSRTFAKKELVYTAPGKELKWWRPTPEALLALGLAANSDIPALKALEHYFDSQASFQNDTQKEAKTWSPSLRRPRPALSRRRRRELERRASLPRD